MDIYRAGALSLIIIGALAALIYAGLIVAEVIKYKAKRRRFERSFGR